MTKIIDKRNLPKNQSIGSRQKFIDRYKGVIKDKIKDIIGKGKLKTSMKGDKKIKIKRDLLDEPSFELDENSGTKDYILIGNKRFKKGEKLPKPQTGSSSGGRKGGESGQDSDDFEWILTEKEFLDLFFEDLELPDLIKKEFLGSDWFIQHAGYSTSGGPTSLNIKKTMLRAIARKKALKSLSVVQLKKELITELINEKTNKKKIQFIEDIDLRYNFKEKVNIPISKAIMFCLMDVSGSMGEKEKDIAKRFFILLNLFLQKNYQSVDVIFIRHTETAEEVDENIFFYDRKSGGTIISSGYNKIKEIIDERYNKEQVNIYIAQASDGENWDYDMEAMELSLTKKLLPLCQYFAYIDIGRGNWGPEKSEVMEVISRLMQSYTNLQGREITKVSEIWEVFKSLFKKKGG